MRRWTALGDRPIASPSAVRVRAASRCSRSSRRWSKSSSASGGLAMQKFCVHAHEFTNAMPVARFTLCLGDRAAPLPRRTPDGEASMSSVTAAVAPRALPGPLAVALALASVYVLWGSTYLAIRFALPGYPPFLLGAVRMFLAGALMYIVLRRRGAKPPSAKQWRTLTVLSIFMVLLSNGLVNLAETQVGSGIAAIAVASMPLFAGVFALLRGRHPTRLEWVGLMVGFAGVIALNAGSALSGSPLGFTCLVI